MAKRVKMPKSWKSYGPYGCYKYKKVHRKSRFIKERKRYFLRQVSAWAIPNYMTKKEILKGFYVICEGREPRSKYRGEIN